MPGFQQDREERLKIRSVLEQLSKLDSGELARKDLGETFDFELGVSLFEDIIGLASEMLENGSADHLWGPAINSALRNLRGVSQALEQIRTAGGESINSPSRDARLNTVNDRWGEFLRLSGTFMVTHSLERRRLAQSEQSVRAKLEAVEQSEAHVASAKKAYEHLAEQHAKRLKEVGVSFHASHFQTEAGSNQAASWAWLGAMIVIGGFTAWYALVELTAALSVLPDKATMGQVVNFTVVRLIVVSLLMFAIGFCSRNYSASLHNFVVNQHRANALQSFLTFEEAAQKPETKDAVLLEATRSIFSPQSSGYVKGVREPQAGGPVIEILRRAVQPTSKE